LKPWLQYLEEPNPFIQILLMKLWLCLLNFQQESQEILN
jgi:hypothetical protein